MLINCLFIWGVPLDLRDTHLMATFRVPVPPAKISSGLRLGSEIGTMHTFLRVTRQLQNIFWFEISVGRTGVTAGLPVVNWRA